MTETTTAPAQDAAEAPAQARYRRYPFLMTIPLGLHYGEYSPRDRYARSASVIEKAFTDSYALSADARIISLDPMNWDSFPGETLTTAIFGVFFENVTQAELAEYAAFAATLPVKELVVSGDEFLPKAEAWVPSQSEFAELSARVNARREQVKAFKSGEAKAASELSGASSSSSGPAQVAVDKEATDDFNEWEVF